MDNKYTPTFYRDLSGREFPTLEVGLTGTDKPSCSNKEIMTVIYNQLNYLNSVVESLHARCQARLRRMDAMEAARNGNLQMF